MHLGDPFAEDEPDDNGEPSLLPPRPCRPTTVVTRKDHGRWAASALVATGVAVEEITSLASLITPTKRASDILRYLYEKGGKRPSAGGGHVADVLRMIAKYHVRSTPAAIAQISKWGTRVRLTYNGMTEKNETTISQMLVPGRMAKYLALPRSLMKAARALRQENPGQAVQIAMRAVAIGFLSHIPIRLGNLIALRLDQHLVRANPPRGRITEISIPAYEVKNSQAIRIPVSEDQAQLLQEWIEDYRPQWVASPFSRVRG
jgi:hypothetical protein